MAEIENRSEDSDEREVRTSIVSASWSGPLPPPAAFEAYEKTLPGAADRIFKNVETESEHRRQLEREASSRQWLGMFMGYGVALAIVVVAAIAVVGGHAWTGGGILAGGLIAAVSVFVGGSKLVNRSDS
jgi:uncharacterized membrane protein